jgi:tetratricopeptide (TPR) repeat protein
LAQSHNNLGMFDLATGQLPEAQNHFTECVAIREKLASRNPSVTQYQMERASSYGNLGTLYAKMGKIEEAERVYKTAVNILEGLLADSPKEMRVAVDLGRIYLGLGYFFNGQRKLETAVDWYSRAIRTLQAALPPGPSSSAARQALHEAYWSRAQALAALERKQEALADYDRAIKLEDGPNHTALRLERADTLAHLGKHAEATAEADALAREEVIEAESLYQSACIFSISSEAVHRDTKISAADRQKLSAQYAARAVELLARSHAAGYFKDPAHLQTLKKDSDLDPLRSREDFKNLFKN